MVLEARVAPTASLMKCEEAEYKLARARQQQQVVAKNHVRQLRKPNSTHFQTLVNMHAQNHSLVAISRHLRMAPCIVARVFLEQVENIDKTKVYKLLLSTLEETDGTMSAMVTDRLRRELRECVEQDVHCSPLCDRVRRSEGDEYEHMMVLRLTQMGIPFENEFMLRERGLAKTPDALLLVPIQVKVNDVWHVVQWIDSKAMAHEIGTENEVQHIAQAHAYVNRFGPGMLVYWMGCDDAHFVPQDDILVVDHLPTNFLYPGQAIETTTEVSPIPEGTTFSFEPMHVETSRDEQGIPQTIITF
ncbi:hypothetical protein Ae201684P_005277 [Aphanomyces euteiches]|uniref:CDAN1-interacting nuclease 1 n=1 Tax=Aphanomyces euteiches TaxID=100861 RepID=A0A6G0X1E0_9STRA|nr:hypothetical protein Ae201684_009524 [Aphanomyces euteiches]KAH9085571.1 hypothetical protein Ae201684P_005277 [Aphanomyces euteiches]